MRRLERGQRNRSTCSINSGSAWTNTSDRDVAICSNLEMEDKTDHGVFAAAEIPYFESVRMSDIGLSGIPIVHSHSILASASVASISIGKGMW